MQTSKKSVTMSELQVGNQVQTGKKSLECTMVLSFLFSLFCVYFN